MRQPRSESVKRENVHPTHEVLIGKTNSVILFIPQNSLGPPSRWQCWTGKQHVLLRTTYSSELWLDVTDSRETGRPNARSLAVFLRNAQRSSTELAFPLIYHCCSATIWTSMLQKPCLKTFWGFRASFAPSKHTKRRRVTLVTKAPGCPRAALIKGPLRGAKQRLKSNAFSFGCSWQLTDCSLETCSSPRVSHLLQSKSDPEGLPCWSHPRSHSRSPCRTRSRSARFFWVFGSPLTAAVDQALFSSAVARSCRCSEHALQTPRWRHQRAHLITSARHQYLVTTSYQSVVIPKYEHSPHCGHCTYNPICIWWSGEITAGLWMAWSWAAENDADLGLVAFHKTILQDHRQ